MRSSDVTNAKAYTFFIRFLCTFSRHLSLSDLLFLINAYYMSMLQYLFILFIFIILLSFINHLFYMYYYYIYIAAKLNLINSYKKSYFSLQKQTTLKYNFKVCTFLKNNELYNYY